MPRSRKRKPKLSNRAILAGFILLVAALGLMAGAAWLLLKPSPPSPPPPGPSRDSLGRALARATLARFGRPPLEKAGKIAFSRNWKTSSGVFHSMAWSGQTDTDLILAEKAVEDLWHDHNPRLEVALAYPDHSQEGERTRLMASLGGKPLIEVLLLREESPPVSPAPPAPTPRPEWPKIKPGASPGRIAVIIDDIGNDPRAVDDLLRVRVPMTFSVLPFAPYAREAQERLAAAGVEIMLHLPMQPLGYPEQSPGEGALLVGMSPDQIVAGFRRALAAVPQAKGVNNHMGSAFTADPAGMKVLLEEIGRSGLFFIDSRTNPQTVAYQLARELHVRAAERKVFLDHDQEPDHIRSRLLDLAAAAQENGQAIAIGHPYPETIAVLREELPRMEREGYQFVSASEMVE